MEILSEDYIVVGQETLDYPTDVGRPLLDALVTSQSSMMSLSTKRPNILEVRGHISTEIVKSDIQKIRILFENIIFVDNIFKNEIRIIKKGTNIELADQMEVLKEKFGDKFRNVIVEKTRKKNSFEENNHFPEYNYFDEGGHVKEVSIKLYKEPLPNLVYILNIRDVRNKHRNT